MNSPPQNKVPLAVCTLMISCLSSLLVFFYIFRNKNLVRLYTFSMAQNLLKLAREYLVCMCVHAPTHSLSKVMSWRVI